MPLFSLKAYKFLLKLIFILFLLSIPVAFYGYKYFVSPGNLKKETLLVIPEGSSLEKIANILDNNEIITKPKIFTLLVRLFRKAAILKFGEYSFEKQISPKRVYEKLLEGEHVVHKVTIPEGLTVSEIFKILSKEEKLTGEFPQSVEEGYLLPETYNYVYGDSVKKLISIMKHSLEDFLDKEWENNKDKLEGILNNKREVLILASVIEKETSLSEEKSRIASVFLNRLKKNMPLQSDPTVYYAVVGASFRNYSLTKKDLKIDSLYNTYKYNGLPIGAICNPGKDTIKAIFEYKDLGEYYFVANGEGGHSFAKTLSEHNNNRRILKTKN